MLLNMCKSALVVLLIAVMSVSCSSNAPVTVEAGSPLPLWQEGYLDIHAINSGRGECTFMIFPDGTTMVVDAGEFPTAESKHPMVRQRPDDTVRPAETYARHIRHFLPEVCRDSVDYMVVTHYHMDHFGKLDTAYSVSDAGYMLSGVTALYSEIPFRKIIDRSYPDYDSCKLKDTGTFLREYRKFIDWNAAHSGLVAEKFRLGDTSQFVLRYAPADYPDFRIENMVGNGRVWDGEKEIDCYGPDGRMRENGASLGFLLSYGDFDYWTSGDAGSNTPVEIPAAVAIGRKIEACKANHHLSWQTMSSEMLGILRPQVIVSQSFYDHQPDIPTLAGILEGRMRGKCSVFFTNLHGNTIEKYPEITGLAAGYDGHVVIRVCPDGKKFYVYVLDDTDCEYKVKSVHGPFLSEPACGTESGYRTFISHRGVHLKHTVAGENSLKSVRYAAAAGFGAIETDVRMTKDSVLVVMHDSTLNRTCLASDKTALGGPVFVRDLDFSDLRRGYVLKENDMSSPEKIPTLSEFLSECMASGLAVFIEPKLNDSSGRFYERIIETADAVLGRGGYVMTSNNFANDVIRNVLSEDDVKLMGILYQTTFDRIAGLGNTIMAISLSKFTDSEYLGNVAKAKKQGLQTESHADKFEDLGLATSVGVDFLSTDKLAPDYVGQGRTVYLSKGIDPERISKECNEACAGLSLGAAYLEILSEGTAEVTLAGETFVIGSGTPETFRHQVMLTHQEPARFSITGQSPDFRILSLSLRIVDCG